MHDRFAAGCDFAVARWLSEIAEHRLTAQVT
jgi:hypothetical protein